MRFTRHYETKATNAGGVQFSPSENIRFDIHLPLFVEVAVHLFPFLGSNLLSLAASNKVEQRIIFNQNCPLDIHSLLNLNWPDMFIYLRLANCVHSKQMKDAERRISFSQYLPFC